MLLLGPVALKLASIGYRFARYYTGGVEYLRLGPPAPVMRFLVAPVLVVSTLTLFGSGVALLAAPHRGQILGLHKASFVVWFGAMTIHSSPTRSAPSATPSPTCTSGSPAGTACASCSPPRRSPPAS